MKNILVVDDAATVRLYHRKILSDAGWQVSEANNGIEALEKVLGAESTRPFDLFVVDVNMPKMDGYTFVRTLRRDGDRGVVPVLMVSTESKARDAHAAQDAGANAYLTKPCQALDLVLTAALLMGDAATAHSTTLRMAERKA